MAKYSPKTKDELVELVNDESVNLGDIDTSAIDDMSELFQYSERTDFSGIEKWDTSKVKTMESMFQDSSFNYNINDWNVSSVENMNFMFGNTPFNQPLDKWNVSKVTNMNGMFYISSFNQPLDKWNVSSVTDMEAMFNKTPFNQPLNNWNVSSVEDMRSMFKETPFNQPLDKWNVSKVANMWCMFCESSFNQPLNDWDVSSVETMQQMFYKSSFNQPLDKWNVSKVTDMSHMFSNTPFNQSLDKWDVSNVKSIYSIFEDCPLKANPPKWYRKSKNVGGKVVYCPQTRAELEDLACDEDINLGDIDTSAIDDMSELFYESGREDFSGIEKWDTSKVNTMKLMFAEVENFDKDISSWNVAKVKDMSGMFDNICDKVKLPSWYLKWVEKNTDELLGYIDNANAICEQLKVAYIVKVDCDYDIEEVLEKYPSRLQATWALKDKEENGELDDDKDYYAVIGYEPKEISVKDLEPLVGMDIITADWLLRMGIHRAIAFDNTAGVSYGGSVGKIYGVYATRLEIIEMIEKDCPDEWLQEGDVQCIGYQPKFDVEETFIGRDYLLLMDALRWVGWLKEGWETYWWLEVVEDDGTIVRVVKEICGDFNKASKYKYKLPPAESGRYYVLGNNAGEWLTSLGDEKRDEEDYDEDEED